MKTYNTHKENRTNTEKETVDNHRRESLIALITTITATTITVAPHIYLKESTLFLIITTGILAVLINLLLILIYAYQQK